MKEPFIALQLRRTGRMELPSAGLVGALAMLCGGVAIGTAFGWLLSGAPPVLAVALLIVLAIATALAAERERRRQWERYRAAMRRLYEGRLS